MPIEDLPVFDSVPRLNGNTRIAEKAKIAYLDGSIDIGYIIGKLVMRDHNRVPRDLLIFIKEQNLRRDRNHYSGDMKLIRRNEIGEYKELEVYGSKTKTLSS